MLLIAGLSDVNPLAVFVAGMAPMVTGVIWFAPKLFGNVWARLTGKDLKPAARWLVAGFASSAEFVGD